MNFGKADLHIHTNISDGVNTVEQILDYVHKHTDLNIIAITDHDTIKGALLAQKIIKQKKYKLKIIIGEEVSTQSGHILALFIKKRIQPGLSIAKTIQEIHKQNGLAIPSHPFFKTKVKDNRGLQVGGIGLDKILDNLDSIDAIEIINGTPVMMFQENAKSYFANKYFQKPGIGGSDAHHMLHINKGITLYSGTSKKDLYNSIKNNTVHPKLGNWNIFHLMHYGFYIFPYFISFLNINFKIILDEILSKNNIFSVRFNNNIDPDYVFNKKTNKNNPKDSGYGK